MMVVKLSRGYSMQWFLSEFLAHLLFCLRFYVIRGWLVL